MTDGNGNISLGRLQVSVRAVIGVVMAVFAAAGAWTTLTLQIDSLRADLVASEEEIKADDAKINTLTSHVNDMRYSVREHVTTMNRHEAGILENRKHIAGLRDLNASTRERLVGIESEIKQMHRQLSIVVELLQRREGVRTRAPTGRP